MPICDLLSLVFGLFLVLDSKKVGASIKNPLLGLRQPWGLRCGLYKQFNIWSMADLCTLPWLFVLTGPCRDCLPTLPHLKKRKETIIEGWVERLVLFKIIYANDKSSSQEAGSEGPPSNLGLASPAAWGLCGLLGLFLKLGFRSCMKSCSLKLPTSNLKAVTF